MRRTEPSPAPQHKGGAYGRAEVEEEGKGLGLAAMEEEKRRAERKRSNIESGGTERYCNYHEGFIFIMLFPRNYHALTRVIITH